MICQKYNLCKVSVLNILNLKNHLDTYVDGTATISFWLFLREEWPTRWENLQLTLDSKYMEMMR